MNLDATAGNRVMWKGKTPPDFIFVDREYNLAKPPDVFADNRYLPFRDNVFDLTIYDPPYHVRGSNTKWMFFNPDQTKTFGGATSTHYGLYRSKRELITNLHKATKEFLRVSSRLCFKWGEGTLSLWKILPLFKPWVEVFRRWVGVGGYQRKSRTVWVTFTVDKQTKRMCSK